MQTICHHVFFLFNATATPHIYPLSLHDALPIFTADHVSHLTAFLDERIHGADSGEVSAKVEQSKYRPSKKLLYFRRNLAAIRSEEHTSELQSLTNLVCRLLLEKKKKKNKK